jgi:hypothetical protein
MGGFKDLPESTTTRKAGGLDFTAIGGKRQGREVPQSLKTTRWNRVRSTRFGKPNNQFKEVNKQEKGGDHFCYEEAGFPINTIFLRPVPACFLLQPP